MTCPSSRCWPPKSPAPMRSPSGSGPMRPDAQMLMQRTLTLGPDYCPSDLFSGSVDRIVLGRKVHANTISHARFVALEETFPKLRAAMGPEAFHAASERHLANPAV